MQYHLFLYFLCLSGPFENLVYTIFQCNYFFVLPQSSRKLFQVCQTKCPASIQCSVGHFDHLPDIFLTRWSANMSGNSCLPCGTFSVSWALLDKMSGNVRALCRTLAKVCRTCPACPAYFARTGSITPRDVRDLILKGIALMHTTGDMSSGTWVTPL